MKIVGWMVGYAAVLVAGGLLAVLLAPDPSRATSALYATGAAAVLVLIAAGLSAMLPKSKPLGMIGIHVGLLLPLLFAGVFMMRAVGVRGDVAEYREQRERFAELVRSDIEPDTDEAFTDWLVREAYRDAYQAGEIDVEFVGLDAFRTAPEFRRLRRVNDHDKTYLVLVLGGLAAISAAAFVGMLRQRPKPEDRGKAGAGEGETPGA